MCVIAGTRGQVRLEKGSRAHRIYQQPQMEGEYLCTYAVNPEKQDLFESGGMVFSGRGAENEPRIAEVPTHPFYIATLFLPQMDSWEGRPNPLFVEFVRAAESRVRVSGTRFQGLTSETVKH